MSWPAVTAALHACLALDGEIIAALQQSGEQLCTGEKKKHYKKQKERWSFEVDCGKDKPNDFVANTLMLTRVHRGLDFV